MTGERDDRPPPDFAMLRAVEILASLYERARSRTPHLPPPVERPLLLFNEALALEIGVTRRADVGRILGHGVPYPAAGWETHALEGRDHLRLFLSLFFRDDVLIGAELYVPRGRTAPALVPRRLRSFRLLPGEIEPGMSSASLDERFGRLETATGALYDETFVARYPGGVAYLFARDGVLDRIALYRDDDTAATNPEPCARPS